MAWQDRISEGLIPKGRFRQTWEEGIQKILRKRWTEWKRVRAITPDRERWKALFKPSTPTGGKGSTKCKCSDSYCLILNLALHIDCLIG
jgi:hypothetical protein